MGASLMCDCLISSGTVVSSNYPNRDNILNFILDSRQGGKNDFMEPSVENIAIKKCITVDGTESCFSSKDTD